MAFLGQLPGKSTLGNRIGSDLAEGLQGLAQHKLQQKHSQELEKIGFPKQLASIFHTLDPKVQEGIWKQVNLSNIGQLQQQGQQQMQQAQPQQMQSTFTPEQTEFIKTLSPLDRQKAAQQFQMQNQQQQQAPISSQPSQQFGQAAAQQQIAEQLGQNQQAPKSIFEGGHNGDKLGEQKSLADYKAKIAQDTEERKIEHADIKESKKYLHEKNKKAKGIKENNLRLDRMRKLVHKGELTPPEAAAALDTLAHGIWGVGINLKGMQNEDSQEFEKLSNDMLKGIQDIFGSRILKTEVDNFMKTIPTLLQSDSGKIAVIDNLKMLSEANLQEDKLAKQIVRDNGGKVPANLEQIVEEQLGDYLDELHERFVNQTHEVPVKTAANTLMQGFAKRAFKAGLTGSLI
jgi:hypothetical protein